MNNFIIIINDNRSDDAHNVARRRKFALKVKNGGSFRVINVVMVVIKANYGHISVIGVWQSDLKIINRLQTNQFKVFNFVSIILPPLAPYGYP